MKQWSGSARFSQSEKSPPGPPLSTHPSTPLARASPLLWALDPCGSQLGRLSLSERLVPCVGGAPCSVGSLAARAKLLAGGDARVRHPTKRAWKTRHEGRWSDPLRTRLATSHLCARAIAVLEVWGRPIPLAPQCTRRAASELPSCCTRMTTCAVAPSPSSTYASSLGRNSEGTASIPSTMSSSPRLPRGAGVKRYGFEALFPPCCGRTARLASACLIRAYRMLSAPCSARSHASKLATHTFQAGGRG